MRLIRKKLGSLHDHHKQHTMSNAPTKEQKAKWEKMRALGCVLCGATASIHHCGTGMGGRKDHDKVAPLCHEHHQGKQGIHTLGRKRWQQIYGTEQELMAKVDRLLGITF